jgi:hypothetical protein
VWRLRHDRWLKRPQAPLVYYQRRRFPCAGALRVPIPLFFPRKGGSQRRGSLGSLHFISGGASSLRTRQEFVSASSVEVRRLRAKVGIRGGVSQPWRIPGRRWVRRSVWPSLCLSVCHGSSVESPDRLSVAFSTGVVVFVAVFTIVYCNRVVPN